MDTKLIIFIFLIIILWPGPDKVSTYFTPPNPEYRYSGSLDHMSHEVNTPPGNRNTDVFHNVSPGSWPFNNPHKESMLNVQSRGPVSGIPHLPESGTPPYDYGVIRGMNV